MGYGATFGILGGHGPLGPPKSAYGIIICIPDSMSY